jgi:hypothetical protein
MTPSCEVGPEGFGRAPRGSAFAQTGSPVARIVHLLPVVAADPRPPAPTSEAADIADVWFRCETCKGRVRAQAFRVDAGRLWLRCSNCMGETAATGRVAGPERSRGEVWVSDDGELLFPRDEDSPVKRVVDPYAPVPGYCVKCISPRGQGLSCPACGVLHALPAPAKVLPSFHLRKSWQELITRWDEPSGHAQIMRSAQSRGELGALGRLYRIWLTYFPEDTSALHGRDEVVRLATIPIVVASTVYQVPTQKRRPLGTILLMLLGLILGTVSLIVISSRRTPAKVEQGIPAQGVRAPAAPSWPPPP